LAGISFGPGWEQRKERDGIKRENHGCGIFSRYSHLSRIETGVNTELKKGDTLGLTGSTGMAGGDHLHFAMLVQGIFVNPIEWWDEHWIKDNIELKMKFLEGSPQAPPAREGVKEGKTRSKARKPARKAGRQ
jgi:murein DD-endopeptidase MepM/ murein hydrolase activator NlpD